MTARKLNILFTTWDGGGNIPPVLEAARRLVARGHQVRLMADETVRAAAAAAGIGFTPWREAPQRRDTLIENDPIKDWTAEGPMGGIAKLRDIIMAGGALGYARDTAAELDRAPYDLVVTSEMVLGALIAAEARGVGLAILSANVALMPIPGIPPMGPGFAPAMSEAERTLHAEVAAGARAMFNEGLPALNAARAVFGLAPVSDIFDQFAAAARMLVATSPAFDFPAAELPEGLVYIGPMTGTPVASDGWTSPFAGQDLRPLVLVAFSTTYQAQQTQIANAITALGRLPVRALVTLGPALAAARFDAPANVKTVAEAPHDAVMAEAGLVITHAGHGTVIRALSHGTPLICLPMGRDQNDNAARVDWHGAGIRLDPAAGADAIEAAIRTVFGDTAYRKAARRLQTAIGADIIASPFIAEIEALGAAGRPGVDFAPAA
ncbi:MAG: glycosyltransferase [Micropepsaceae bacterium]